MNYIRQIRKVFGSVNGQRHSSTMKINSFLLGQVQVIMLLILNFREVLPQFSVVKPDTSHYPQPDPAIARILDKNCNISDYINHGVSDYWTDFFEKTVADGNFSKFLKTPKATRQALNDVCYFDNSNHGYLYQCIQEDHARCQCMKHPVETLAVQLDPKTGHLSCLVDENQVCVAEQRTKPNPSSPKMTIPEPYLCIPDHYCDLKLKKCVPCYDPDPKKRKTIKPDPLCPDAPKVNNANVFLGSTVFLVWAVIGTRIWM